MNYKFVCPNCGANTEIQMPISEYTGEGHFCECGTELKRDPKSFCCNYEAKCEGFYGKTSK